MREDGPLPAGACLLLIMLGVIFDGLKLLFNVLFIGFLINPVFVTPVAWLSFAIILWSNGRIMFRGKRAAVSAVNMVVSFIPILDTIPDWTAYAIYLSSEGRGSGRTS